MEFTLARAKAGHLLTASNTPAAGAGGFSEGVIIISQFVSSARVMRGALTVNPWNIEEVLKLRALFAFINMLYRSVDEDGFLTGS